MHYQVKITDIGQLCLRAREHPDIVGFLWRKNDYGGRSATGYFGQVALFPSAMNPALNPFMEYRIGGDYFTGTMPVPTETWQDIPAEPLATPWQAGWYELDKPDAPPQDWKEEQQCDMWLLDD